MNLKTICTGCLAVVLLCGGCGEKSEAVEGNTIGTRLASSFRQEAKNNEELSKIAEVLSQSEEFGEITMVTQPVEEGYLVGFGEEITGFEEGVAFMPMISTIPFVGYVFKSEDAEALAQKLEECGDLNWNICTQADEKVVDTEGEYVFFCMAPESFE